MIIIAIISRWEYAFGGTSGAHCAPLHKSVLDDQLTGGEFVVSGLGLVQRDAERFLLDQHVGLRDIGVYPLCVSTRTDDFF